MKNFILSFILITISHVTHSQVNWTTVITAQDTSYAPRDFIINDLGEVLIGGFFFDEENDRNVMLYEISETTGDPQNLNSCKQTGECSNVNDILHIEMSASNEIYSAGGIKFGNGGDYIAKMDTENYLSYEWIVELPYDIIHHVNKLLPVSDGVIILGQFSDFRFVVLKYDNLGNRVWQANLEVEQVGGEIEGSVLANGDVIIFYTDGLNSGLNYLSIIDNEGNVTPATELDYRSITSRHDSLGNTYSINLYNEDNDRKYSLEKYSINGISSIIIDSITGISSPRLLEFGGDKNIFIGGNNSSEDKFTMLKVSDEGVILNKWDKVDSESNDNITRMNTSNDNKSIILAGLTGQSIIACSINIEDNLSQVSDIINLDFSIYPNPISETLNIESTSKSSNLYYELIDMKGNKVKHGQLSSNINSLQFNNYLPGTYILVIKDDLKTVLSQQLVKL